MKSISLTMFSEAIKNLDPTSSCQKGSTALSSPYADDLAQLKLPAAVNADTFHGKFSAPDKFQELNLVLLHWIVGSLSPQLPQFVVCCYICQMDLSVWLNI